MLKQDVVNDIKRGLNLSKNLTKWLHFFVYLFNWRDKEWQSLDAERKPLIAIIWDKILSCDFMIICDFIANQSKFLCVVNYTIYYPFFIFVIQGNNSINFLPYINFFSKLPDTLRKVCCNFTNILIQFMFIC